LQQTHIRLRVHPVAAFCALRSNEAKGLPGAQSRRGNSYAAGYFAYSKQTKARSIPRRLGEILSA
jgi:predicted AlkP superfamily phosphohydrolase/phosphomutase